VSILLWRIRGSQVVFHTNHIIRTGLAVTILAANGDESSTDGKPMWPLDLGACSLYPQTNNRNSVESRPHISKSLGARPRPYTPESKLKTIKI
jgi:hypothetical protein